MLAACHIAPRAALGKNRVTPESTLHRGGTRLGNGATSSMALQSSCHLKITGLVTRSSTPWLHTVELVRFRCTSACLFGEECFFPLLKYLPGEWFH